MKNLKRTVDELIGILKNNKKYDEELMFEVAKKKVALKIVESYDKKMMKYVKS